MVTSGRCPYDRRRTAVHVTRRLLRIGVDKRLGIVDPPSAEIKGTPRTRQSPLTLAAFRPWGSSQDARRAGSVGQCSGSSITPHHPGPARTREHWLRSFQYRRGFPTVRGDRQVTDKNPPHGGHEAPAASSDAEPTPQWWEAPTTSDSSGSSSGADPTMVRVPGQFDAYTPPPQPYAPPPGPYPPQQPYTPPQQQYASPQQPYAQPPYAQPAPRPLDRPVIHRRPSTAPATQVRPRGGGATRGGSSAASPHWSWSSP